MITAILVYLIIWLEKHNKDSASPMGCLFLTSVFEAILYPCLFYELFVGK